MGSDLLYLRPESLGDLLSLLEQHGRRARLLAGGTDLLVRLKKGHDLPAAVIDLKRVPELRSDITEAGGALRIGARAVMTDLVQHARLRTLFPALIEAALVVGSVQIRNRATVAGNLCNASPAADTATPLLAYGAQLNLISAGGSRRLSLDDFFSGPGRTTLAAGEIVASIDLPLTGGRTRSAFTRLTRRHGVDLAIVNACCVVRESGDARFAFGAVGPRPFVVETRDDAGLDEIVRRASPISDLRASEEYRAAMVPILARRALQTAKKRLSSAAASA